MMRKTIQFCLACLLLVVVTGCAYPQEQLAQNQIPYADQIEAVQSAVNRFQEDNGGILPIKTKDADTPIYQKYLIDFNRIVPKYLSSPPGNAFESGGIFQYVLIDVETNPTVKLLDLRMSEALRDINLRLKSHQYPPFKGRVEKDVFTLNFEKMGYKEEPYVVSPFSNQNLSFVITGKGEVYVDYRSDLYQLLQKEDVTVQPGDDIRSLLTKDSFFVPAYSLPYTIDSETKEPIFLSN